MQLRAPNPDEAERLTELCLRSKAVWGYDADFMQACRAELTIRPADLAQSAFRVAMIDGEIVGVAQIAVTGDDAELAKLFIAPGAIGTGVGKTLFAWAVNEARAGGAMQLWIEADPDAAAFYRRMGATDAGSVPSGSIPGRFLPRLRFDLQA
ncbi:MAG: GNAT family N-acetyltransferase [Xanthobacteraceae bacterium]